MTKPRVPNTRTPTSGPPPKAGDHSSTHPSRRPKEGKLPPLAPDGTRRVPPDQAPTQPRIPFARHAANEPPVEAAKGDDDAMSEAQTVIPGAPARP